MNSTISLKRTTSEDKDFQKLAEELEKELRIRDGEEHELYAELNKIDKIDHVLVAYEYDEPIGCGAIRHYSSEAMEIKRMFVPLHKRGRRIASLILTELEMWCRELAYRTCLLETGKNQPEALRLYEKNGYQRIENFGKYIGSENSVCFEKAVKQPQTLN